MSRIRDYRPIEYRQVCAIARLVLTREPAMTDAEWKEAVKDTCQRQGYDNPPAEMLVRAMGAVERALLETMGPRVPHDQVPSPTPPQPDRCWTAADYRAFAETLKHILARSAGANGAVVGKMPTAPSETLDISEPAALDQFYAEAHVGDRVAVLRRFAEIAIVRPAEWDYASIRAASQRTGSRSGECFACRADSRALISHHVIQIQHGGSNYVRNRVALCEACHADVHPWLPKAVRAARTRGWSSLTDLMPAAFALMESWHKRDNQAS